MHFKQFCVTLQCDSVQNYDFPFILVVLASVLLDWATFLVTLSGTNFGHLDAQNKKNKLKKATFRRTVDILYRVRS